MPMFDTAVILTLTLAKAIGLYMVVVGLTGLVDASRWKIIIGDFRVSPGLTYVTAVLVFLLGLVLISIHSHWSDPLAVVISLFGWLALAEGVLLLAAPNGLLKLGGALVDTSGRARAFAVFAIIAGVVLLIAGVTGRATFSA